MNDLEFVGDYRNPQQLTARQRELGFDGQSDGDFTFGDFLDIINPLQHIPIVSSLYREITGDEISPHARILGDTLFSGPAGFLSAIANVFYEEVAGEDLGETALALFNDEEESAEPQFAENGDPGSMTAAPLTTAAGPAAAPSPAPVPSPLPSANNAVPPQDSAAAGMLTGQDALNALFNDLRRTPTAGPAMPPGEDRAEALPLPQRDAQAMKSYPLPPRAATSGAATTPPPQAASAEPAADEAAIVHPLIMAQDAPKADIAERMMEALDKYRTMGRQGLVPSAAERADDDSKAEWRADPDPGAPWQFDPATPAGHS